MVDPVCLKADVGRVTLGLKKLLTVTKKPVAVPQELEAIVGTI